MLMKGLKQTIVMTHAEFCLDIRRGGLIIGVAAVSLVITAGTLFLGSLYSGDMQGLPGSDSARMGAKALASAWPAFEWLTLGLLPIVASSAIPLDRQFGVDEVLRSLPLTGSVYLAGKILGTLSVVVLAGGVALAVHVFLHWAVLGPLETSLYLQITLLSGLPLSLWAATIGVLIGCGFRTRRTAIVGGVLAGIGGYWIWNASSLFIQAADPSLTEQTNRLSYQAISKLIFGHYALLPAYVPAEPNVGSEALQSFIIALIVLLGIITIARLWLSWKEDF